MADRSTSITRGRLAKQKKARHAGRPPSLQPVTPKPAHTLTVAEGGEVKKTGEEHRERWAADLYAFIRARP